MKLVTATITTPRIQLEEVINALKQIDPELEMMVSVRDIETGEAYSVDVDNFDIDNG